MSTEISQQNNGKQQQQQQPQTDPNTQIRDESTDYSITNVSTIKNPYGKN